MDTHPKINICSLGLEVDLAITISDAWREKQSHLAKTVNREEGQQQSAKALCLATAICQAVHIHANAFDSLKRPRQRSQEITPLRK